MSIGAGSFDELRRLLADPAALREGQARQRPRLVEEFLRPWFHELDGKAAERVATLALGALADRPRVRRSALASLFGSRRASLGRLLSGLASNTFGSRRGSRLIGLRMPHRAGKAVGVEDVREGIARLCALEHRAAAFSVAHARHPVSRLSMASIRVAPA